MKRIALGLQAKVLFGLGLLDYGIVLWMQKLLGTMEATTGAKSDCVQFW
jgi:hypothetical protein